MRFLRCETQRIVPAAGQEYAITLLGESENGLVRGIARKGFSRQYDIVAELLNQ